MKMSRQTVYRWMDRELVHMLVLPNGWQLVCRRSLAKSRAPTVAPLQSRPPTPRRDELGRYVESKKLYASALSVALSIRETLCER